MAQQANLVARWKATRTLPFRIKDSLFGALRGPTSETNQLTGLAELLEQQMQVYTDNGVLTIQVYWRDPDSTLELAQLAQSRFLELSRTQELAAITAAISINEEEVKRAAEGIDRSLEVLMQVRQRARDSTRLRASGTASTEDSKAPKSDGHSAVALAAASATPSPPDKKLAARLADIRQQAHDLEAPWQRRLAELKFQLSDLRVTYGPEHPMMLQQEAKIKEAERVPGELTALRERERQFLSEIEQTTAEDARPAVSKAGIPTKAIAPTVSAQSRLISADGALVIAEREDDPVVAPARANLASAIQNYTEITRRLETARLELTSTQVALKYRYVVVNEPELPRRPIKPNRPVIILGALLAAAVAGLLAGAVRDLLSGKVVAPWQVRALGLAVIGEVDLLQKKPLSGRDQPV